MLCLPVTELSQVAQARRTALKIAQNLGFSETDVGKVSLIATELGTNLVKHATQGQLLMQDLMRNDTPGVELLALDKGPGMANVAECLRDGYSTQSSPGSGLGAIVRLASLSEIYSLLGMGTVVLARIEAASRSTFHASRSAFQSLSPEGLRTSNPQPLKVGVICIPKSGEIACGDAWAIDQRPGRSVVMVVDGLGHGPAAADAAQAALRTFCSRATLSPAQMIEAIHSALRSTRGAAVAVAEINPDKQQTQYCGVGNVAGVVVTPTTSYSLVSHNGIVGHEVRKIQEFTYPWPKQARLVMHSDGLMSRWDLAAYPGLLARHPSVMSGVLYRDFNRGRDDVTVVVAKASHFK